MADGEVHPSELKFLKDVAEILGLNASDFARIRAVHMAADGGDPYAVLGLHHGAEDAEIKARYRQLARDNHPDKLMAEGLPEEVIAVANQKLARQAESSDRQALELLSEISELNTEVNHFKSTQEELEGKVAELNQELLEKQAMINAIAVRQAN